MVETIGNHKCILAEGPVWDASQNAILWVDIIQGAIHQYSLNENKLKTYPIHEMVGCFAIDEDENLIMASKSGIAFLDRITGEIIYHSNPESHLPNNRFNDGKCDPTGRFWFGSMSLSEDFEAGNVYVFDNLTLEKKIESVTISNGMAWSIDHKTVYYIDTPTFEVVAFDYEKSTGNISNRKSIITIPKEEGYPDGMTIDNEGMLWIAHWGGWQVTRWNPQTGEKLHHFKLPTSRITSCTFGGEHLNDLYITSASVGLSEEELIEQPLAGSLFIIKNCGFTGLPAFKFKH